MRRCDLSPPATVDKLETADGASFIVCAENDAAEYAIPQESR